jgi:hypothetical protein
LIAGIESINSTNVHFPIGQILLCVKDFSWGSYPCKCSA